MHAHMKCNEVIFILFNECFFPDQLFMMQVSLGSSRKKKKSAGNSRKACCCYLFKSLDQLLWAEYYEAKIVYFNHILSALGGSFAIDVFVFVPPWRSSARFVHGLWLESWNGNTVRKTPELAALALYVHLSFPPKLFSFLKLNKWICDSEDVNRSVVPCASAHAHRRMVSSCRRPLETAWHQEIAF